VRRNTKADASIFLIIAIVLLLGGGIFIVSNVLRSDPIEEALSGNEIINLLLVLEGEEAPLGCYVLMYSPQNNRAAAISIPGDVGLILKSIDRVGRIDSVYDPKNTEIFQGEVENLLELTIRYSVVFELEKFGKIVDLIGGVELFIPSELRIYDEVPILFPSGNTRLDGDKAKQYLSYELPEEDQTEINLRRERLFLSFLESLGEQKVLLEDREAGKLFYSLLKTGMNRLTRKRLFESLSALDIDRVTMQSIAGSYQEVSGQSLLLPHYNGTVIKDIVRQTQRSLAQQVQGSLAERIFTVEILNGTSTTGLASRTAELLRGFHYDVVSEKNADRNDYEQTEIIDHTGLDDVAATLGGIIQCENIRYEERIPVGGAAALPGVPAPGFDSDQYGADFVLILGKDFNGRIVTGK
jgi:anionic cell wall polymer biosynthesis LytR-Cps2A-Psr (LCP) family protein